MSAVFFFHSATKITLRGNFDVVQYVQYGTTSGTKITPNFCSPGSPLMIIK